MCGLTAETAKLTINFCVCIFSNSLEEREREEMKVKKRLSYEGGAEMQAFSRTPGPAPLSSMRGGPRGSGGGGSHGMYVCTCMQCASCAFVGFCASADVCMFLINEGGMEGEFGQRDRLWRERESGMLVIKRQVENASHKRPPASLCHHSHKTPPPATSCKELGSTSLPAAFCIVLHQAAARHHGLPGDCCLVPSQSPIPFLLTTKGGSTC